MLKDEYPELAKYWNYERNDRNGVYFEDVTNGSDKKVWWICEKGHEWEAPLNNVSNGSGCPVCSGNKVLPGFNDLATKNPQLASEWNYERNGELKPQGFTVSSDKKVWWTCKNGHEWEARIAGRNSGKGCPYCAGKKRP